MLPPELDSIAQDVRTRFRTLVAADTGMIAIGDLLGAVQLVQEFVLGLGRGMAQDFVDVRTEQALANRARCACGEVMEVHRRAAWDHKTLLGVISVRDPYTYCRACGASDRPLHAWLGTGRETWSLLAQEAAVDLATDESCEKAVDKLARHHPGVDMGRTTALRLLHEHGARAREFIDNTLGMMRDLAEEPLPAEKLPEEAEELEAEFDGGMVPVASLEPIPVVEGKAPELTPVRKLPKRRKNARWEEVKAGLVQRPGETTRLYTLRPTSGLDEAFDDLLGLAVLKGWTERTSVRGIADGARHIRVRMGETFHASPFRFILDRPHAKEHLTAAGTALAPDGLTVQEWAAGALARMESGDASSVVDELRDAYEASGADEATRNDVLRKEAAYFARNSDAVAYADYRDRGWSTASSEIESAHRDVVQQRLKIAGAWWHPDHIDDILALRMLRKNGWWDDYWAAQQQRWRDRAQKLRDERDTTAP